MMQKQPKLLSKIWVNKMSDKKRIVIKIGTSSLTYENGKINLGKMEHLVRVVADLKNSGMEVILVSSAAIAVGQNRLGLKDRPSETREKQATAAVGQCDLMSTYSRLFHEYGWNVAQILLTRDCIDNQHRRENAVNTLECLLEMGALPIVNENDTVAIEEIVFGDNDRLSAIVADLCSADMLIILTDTDGLYDSDPHKNPSAKLITEVDEINDNIYDISGGAGTKRGTGGMYTKIEAAEYATERGIDTVVMSGNDTMKIYDLLNGESVGTFFKSKRTDRNA